MICPSCRGTQIGSENGHVISPACKAGFEIDDRGECVFVDRDDLRIPADGQGCTVCGLIQQDKRDSCIFCGPIFNKTVH